jgi:hypothetical protein
MAISGHKQHTWSHTVHCDAFLYIIVPLAHCNYFTEYAYYEVQVPPESFLCWALCSQGEGGSKFLYIHMYISAI